VSDRRPTADDPFAAERPRLLGLAYRMLGSLADAEDVVQDAWLRWAGTEQAVIENPAAWLTTTTTRLALDRLRALSRRREDYVGPWLPEPITVAASTDANADPAAATELAESMTLGFLVVLDTLSATERAVFLLAEVFGEPYASIAAAVGKTEENCRQIASRARRKVRAARHPETTPAPSDLLARLLWATSMGDIDELLTLLDTDVVLLSDGGAERRAARRPVVGADKVARFMVNLAKKLVAGSVETGTVNGEEVVIFHLDDGPMVFGGDVHDGRFVSVQVQRNPSKLTHLVEPTDLR
jgi:RNA polymerase sigma-70 factor (ECF subfamily)